MTTIIDFILDLFRSPAAAQSFVVDPDGPCATPACRT